MIRLVHITGSLGFGGVERVVISLCDKLDKGQFELHIISLSDHVPLAAFLENQDEIHIHTCGRPPSVGDMGIHFPSTIRMYRLLNHIKPHIIHTHLYHLNSLAYALTKKIPHVITIHGTSIIAIRNRARQLLFAAANAGKHKASYSIVVSESVKREIVERFHSNYSSVEVIHNGIDTDYFQKKTRRPKNSSDIPIAINIARHVKGKGIETLLKAWSIATAKHSGRLYLVGDGPMHEDYRKLSEELDISQSVVFLGARNDVRELMQESDFGIFPSETEGMPMAPAEMMAMELPVIGSDIAPLLELINPPETGEAVPVTNPQALAEKIVLYLQNPQVALQKGQLARKRIIGHFSLNKQVEKHESFYQKILHNA